MDPTGNGDFNWTDGSAYDYNNWCPGSPYLPPTCQPDSSDQCISVTSFNSQWSSIDCNTAQYYICKIQATVDNGSITTCPTNKPVIPDTTIRPITINDCESELAQAGYTFGNDGAWDRYHVLIGLMDPTLNGNFYWTDGSPYDYQRWGTCNGQPYLPDGCTTLIADQDTGGCFQEWITSYEETIHRAFVCQKSSIAHICQN
uniref:C-type lectin domain-containing protein n=1 Tax=Acrobeloides nanus TaxID=290746 RepID=A0A914EFD9_9BILA